ncbi:exodeoxyribonuclease VII small subunit [Kytococcus sedentarius]|uniref:exodeoxyribonuclease VII small subunit n=1 Tax=Kytococcus sedentarius TaxID=1276 RepID=UPI00194E7EFF|nr:exodeoxyribonuclease VII small subunit [Kytococcus sedentarius]
MTEQPIGDESTEAPETTEPQAPEAEADDAQEAPDSAGTEDTAEDQGTTGEPGEAPKAAHTDVAGLSYEQAREELVGIVATLERGERPLEESMELWERGEALADHCASWLDAAQQRITERVEARQGTAGTVSSAEGGPSAG